MKNTDRDVTTPLLKGIALMQDGTGTIWVESPTIDGPVSFKRFRLPRIESMQLAWLVDLADVYFEQTRRCLAAMLLLDINSHQWGWCLPWQKCGTEAACWQPERRDGLIVNPNQRLAGLFQSVTVAHPSEVSNCVPPIAGVHILGHYWNQNRGVWGFVRLNDETLLSMEPEDLASDNLTQVLEANAPRMQIV